MNYRNFQLQNLKCMMMDIPKISRAFKHAVDLVSDNPIEYGELEKEVLEASCDEEYIARLLRASDEYEILEFEVIKNGSRKAA